MNETVLLLGGVSVAGAALLAGVVGFSYALVALPLLLLIGIPLDEVVVINLTIGLVTRLTVLIRFRREIDYQRVSVLLIGSAPGILLGIAIKSRVPFQIIELGAGVCVVVGALVLANQKSEFTGNSRTNTVIWQVPIAGLASGVLGITTSLNGVVPAVLFTRLRLSSRAFRGEMAMFLVISNALTLAVLTLNDLEKTPMSYLNWRTAAWTVLAAVGNAVGNAVSDRLPQAVFRRITLIIIIVSGCSSIVAAVT